MRLWTILSIGGYVLGWFERASRDGRLTAEEIVELVQGAAQLAGVHLPIERREADPNP